MPSRIAKGSREYLLERAERLTAASRLCSDVFENFGARRVIPSTFQPLQEVTNPDSAITFNEPETGRMLALRQDLTNQIRRIVQLELAALPTPYKLYYIERIWQSRTVGNRTKEQIQAGIEWLGPGRGAEAELLQLACALVKNLTGKGATLVLGDARFRPAWQRTLKFRNQAAANTALDLRNLSRWRTAGDPGFLDAPLLALTPGQPFPKLPGAVKQLAEQLFLFAKNLPKDIDVVIDPIARPDHDYYSGMFFGISSGCEYDPWLRGGRYDGRFEGKLDALGFALDLDTLSEAADRGLIKMPTPKKRK